MSYRSNIINTYDPYGNTNIVKPAKQLNQKYKALGESLPQTTMNVGMQDRYASEKAALNNLRPLEKEEDDRFEVDYGAGAAAAAGTGVNMVKQAKDAASLAGKDLSKGAQAGIAATGAATAVAGVAGEALDRNKKEVAGGALKGAAAGASMGAAFTPIGAAIGAGIGAIAGGIGGHIKKKRRLEGERQEEEARNRYNANIASIKDKSFKQISDLERADNINRSAQRYDSQGRVITAKSGGILKYSPTTPKKVESEKTGGALKDKKIVEIKPVSKSSPISFKKGGKTKSCKSGCGCTSCGTKTKIFRRGGTLDIAKQNVIVDGPSHDEFNETGVKGDRGLPVVKDGMKIAEIESKELVINSTSSKKIDDLKNKIKSGDIKAKTELADLLHKELSENTYDYAKILAED